MSYQVYRASAAHPNLSSRRVFTGGIYGFLMSFAKMVRETRATHVAFCRDMKPYLRSIEYPQYKQLRKANADSDLLDRYNESMPLVLDLLEDIGLSLWGIEGFESDDLIAHACSKYGHRFDRIYAASNDSDLYQLFDRRPNFFVYAKDIADCMTATKLLQSTGCTPAEYMLATALMGSHNDVEGIRGVGEKTAVKIIKDRGRLNTIKELHGAMIDRNLGLIKLPHRDFPFEARIPEHPGRYDPRLLYRLLDHYDIDCTGSMAAAFEQLLPR